MGQVQRSETRGTFCRVESLSKNMILYTHRQTRHFSRGIHEENCFYAFRRAIMSSHLISTRCFTSQNILVANTSASCIDSIAASNHGSSATSGSSANRRRGHADRVRPALDEVRIDPAVARCDVSIAEAAVNGFPDLV